MKIWIYSLVFAMPSLAVVSQSCPSEYFSAIITSTVDQTVDNPAEFIEDHPELIFFKTHMNLTDTAKNVRVALTFLWLSQFHAQ